MSLSMLEWGFALLAGAVIGFLSGLFGVGGGFLLVPVLNIALGVDINIAVGSSVCQVLGSATTALRARRQERKVGPQHIRLPLIITGGLLLGVAGGAQLLQTAKQAGDVTISGATMPMAELVVLVCYFVLMSGLGLFMIRQSRSGLGTVDDSGWLDQFRLPPMSAFPEVLGRKLSIPVLSWFGLSAGFFSGLLGMSGGLVLFPSLIYLFGLRDKQSSTTSLIIVWIVSVLATAAHAWHGNVDLLLVVALSLGGAFGAQFGTMVVTRSGGGELKHYFGWLVLTAAVFVALRLVYIVY